MVIGMVLLQSNLGKSFDQLGLTALVILLFKSYVDIKT
jgi:hypothetical protein